MKKSIIILGIIATILVAIVLNNKNIYRMYKINQLRNNFINELNGKFNNDTNEITKVEYELYHTSIEDLNHYNITQLVNKYIEMSEKGVEEYKKGVLNKFEVDHININEPTDVEYGKEIWMRYDELKYDIADNITDEDVKNYNNGKFRNILIEKLKTILDYEEKDDKIEWQVNSTEDIRIELPYDCYINYEAYHRKDDDVKKIIDVKFNRSFVLGQNNLDDVYVEYETYEKSIKQKVVTVYCKNINGKEHYSIPLHYVYLSGADTYAKAYLKSHTGDKKWEAQSGVWSYEW